MYLDFRRIFRNKKKSYKIRQKSGENVTHLETSKSDSEVPIIGFIFIKIKECLIEIAFSRARP